MMRIRTALLFTTSLCRKPRCSRVQHLYYSVAMTSKGMGTRRTAREPVDDMPAREPVEAVSKMAAADRPQGADAVSAAPVASSQGSDDVAVCAIEPSSSPATEDYSVAAASDESPPPAADVTPPLAELASPPAALVPSAAGEISPSTVAQAAEESVAQSLRKKKAPLSPQSEMMSGLSPQMRRMAKRAMQTPSTASAPRQRELSQELQVEQAARRRVQALWAKAPHCYRFEDLLCMRSVHFRDAGLTDNDVIALASTLTEGMVQLRALGHGATIGLGDPFAVPMPAGVR